MFIALTAGIEPKDLAVAGTGFYQSGNIGGAIGTNTIAAVQQGTLRASLAQKLTNYPDKEQVNIFVNPE